MIEYINNLTIRDWLAVVAATGLSASILTVLIQWLFCTKSVPRLVLVYRSFSIALFFMSAFTRGLSDEPVPLDWQTIGVYANLALAQSLVMAFTYRRIIHNPDGKRGDRCPQTKEVD